MHRFRGALRHLPALLGLALLVGAVFVVWREFRHLKLADIGVALRAIPEGTLIAGFVLTIASYGLLTWYDRLGTIYAGHKVSYRRAAFASFCAYALSHNLGFAAVSGAAVRYRLYAHWGLTPVQIAKVVAFCSLTFGLGAMVLGGGILTLEPGSVPFLGDRLPRWGLHAVGIAFWLVVAGYLAMARFAGAMRLFGHEARLPGLRMAVRQVTLATLDVALTAAIMYILLPDAPGLTYQRLLGIYVASYSAGLITNLPGGIGVFDAAMLLGLQPYLPPAQILGSVVVFRLYYYIIPLFFAGTLFAGNEVMLRGGTLFRRPPPVLPRWSEPGLAVIAATGAVALSGALLLALGVLDQRPDWSWIDPGFVDVASDVSAFLPSLAGAALLAMAVGLSQRVRLAWGGCLMLLLLAAGFTTAQGTAWWIPAVLVLAALLLAPFREAFYRSARLLADPLQAGTAVSLFTLAGCLLALAAFQPQVRSLGNRSWWALVLSRDVPNRFRVTVALLVVLMLAAIWRLLRPGRVETLSWGIAGRVRYAQLGAPPPRFADGLVLGEAGQAGIPFRRMGRVLLGLGDPAGLVGDRISAIWRLRDLAIQEGLDPAVWRAGPGLLKVYEDLGLVALPLGPDGLPAPEREGDAAPAAHYLCCRAERDLRALLPILPGLAVE